MGSHGALLALRMVEGSDVGDVLTNPSTERHSERLNAPADAQDRQLTIVCQSCDKEFGQVALLIDIAQEGMGFLACIVGVVVATATEHESIDMFQSVDDDVGISQGRNDNGYTASSQYGFIISLSQFTSEVAIIPRNTDNRTLGGLRIFRISACSQL